MASTHVMVLKVDPAAFLAANKQSPSAPSLKRGSLFHSFKGCHSKPGHLFGYCRVFECCNGMVNASNAPAIESVVCRLATDLLGDGFANRDLRAPRKPLPPRGSGPLDSTGSHARLPGWWKTPYSRLDYQRPARAPALGPAFFRCRSGVGSGVATAEIDSAAMEWRSIGRLDVEMREAKEA